MLPVHTNISRVDALQLVDVRRDCAKGIVLDFLLQQLAEGAARLLLILPVTRLNVDWDARRSVVHDLAVRLSWSGNGTEHDAVLVLFVADCDAHADNVDSWWGLKKVEERRAGRLEAVNRPDHNCTQVAG